MPNQLDISSVESIPTHFDVLVVGSGAAGLYGALCLPAHLQIGLITKDSVTTPHTSATR